MSNAVARVYVNDVEVGSLPANQFQRIVDDSRRNHWLYVLQGLNFIAALWRCAVMMLRALPVFLFALLIGIVFFDPDSMTLILAEIAKAKPADITHAIRIAMLIGIGFTIFAFLIASAFGSFGGNPFGYVNQFDDVIYKRIRELLEVPAEGKMQIVVVEGDGHHGQ